MVFDRKPAVPVGGKSSSTSGTHGTTPLRSPVSSFGGPVVSYLSAQHERLMLELLPFKEGGQFREWLAFLQGDWQEYCVDYFLLEGSNNTSLPEPDKTSSAQLAKDAITNKMTKYLTYHPDKTGWTGEDHAVRFIATATADSILRGTWADSEWRRRGLEITRAMFEVLSFLRASELATMQQQAQELQQAVPPPGYDATM